MPSPDMSQQPKALPRIYFDPQLRAKSRRLAMAARTFADQLIVQETAMGRRSRARSMAARRDFHVAVEAVACNFLIMHLLTEKTTLAVPRAHKLMWSGGRYRSSVYGQHFLDVIDVLCALE